MNRQKVDIQNPYILAKKNFFDIISPGRWTYDAVKAFIAFNMYGLADACITKLPEVEPVVSRAEPEWGHA